MESFNEFVDHQGFYDYINHFISGAILVIGIEMLTSLFDLSLIKEIYGALRLIPISPNINEFLWNICVITVFALLCFFVGIFVQELYNVIYNKNPEEKDDVQSKIKDKTPYGINRLFHKVNEYAYVPQMFDNSGIIINSNKRAEYEKYARKLAAKKELNKKEGISEVIPEEKIQIDRKLVIYFFHIVNIIFKYAIRTKKLKN